MPDSNQTTKPRLWKHRKRGTEYVEICRGELQNARGLLVEGATMVVYRGEDGKLWVREQEEFEDGRFQEITDGQ